VSLVGFKSRFVSYKPGDEFLPNGYAQEQVGLMGMAEKKWVENVELRLVGLFVLVFWLFNVLTATRYPFGFQDEAMFATPAIHYLRGDGFRIPFSEMDSLYCFLLVPWIKLFGHSLRSIRAAEITCVSIAFVILWSAVKRLRLVELAFARLLLLVLLSTEFGVILSYRVGRYDGMGFLILASTLWAMSIVSLKVRLAILFVLYMFVPWAGLQFLPMQFTIALVTVILFRFQYWREIAVSFVASGIGTIGFFVGLWQTGRLSVFMQLVHVQQRGFIGNVFHGRFEHHNAIPANYSLICVFSAAVVLLMACRNSESGRVYLTLRYGVLFTICLALILISTTKFPTYYTYMVTIPLMIGICAGLSVCENKRSLVTAGILCAMSSIVGVGVHLFVYSVDAHDRDYSRVVQFVDQTIRPGDVVFCDPAAYLAAVSNASELYMPISDWDIMERMSEEQRKSVNVLLIRPAWVKQAIQGLGGNWKATGEQLLPSGHILFDGKPNLGYLSIPDNHLLIFRRQ
jgi:hypothetical protein